MTAIKEPLAEVARPRPIPGALVAVCLALAAIGVASFLYGLSADADTAWRAYHVNFLYFAGLGVFFPFYTLYLRENAGLSGTEVGIVLATLPLVGMVAQTGQWWLDVRKPKKEEVVAHLVNLAWNGLRHLEDKPRLMDSHH